MHSQNGSPPDPTGLESRIKEAEARLSRGEPLTREEQLALLAGLLAGQATRKERRYGQA
jgi:hypothetical protein